MSSKTEKTEITKEETEAKQESFTIDMERCVNKLDDAVRMLKIAKTALEIRNAGKRVRFYSNLLERCKNYYIDYI